MQNSDTFGSGLPDGSSEPEGMSAIEHAEAAMEKLADKHTHRYQDSWWAKDRGN